MSATAAIHVFENDAAWRQTLAASRAYCRELSRQRARNFYYGMKLVPEPKRSGMDALYAWMRHADDLADAAGDLDGKATALLGFLRDTDQAVDPHLADPSRLPPGRLWPAVRDMVLRYGVPRQYLQDMIDGQLLDQTRTRYKTFAELYDYCYKVASVVGLCCVQIWGSEGGEETRKLAEWRGIAFQLTNILRDVMEDAERGRVYLPAEDFHVFELQPAMFTLGKSGDIVPGLTRVVERARGYYEKSAPLDRLVHPDGRPCLWAMTRIYRGLLDAIERDPAVVLRERVRLSGLRKAWIALSATLRKGAR